MSATLAMHISVIFYFLTKIINKILSKQRIDKKFVQKKFVLVIFENCQALTTVILLDIQSIRIAKKMTYVIVISLLQVLVLKI